MRPAEHRPMPAYHARRRRRALAATPAPAVLILPVLLLAACSGGPPGGQNATVAGTVQVCSSCHGFEGRSVSPTFPNLAGQQKDYLEAQLKAFRDHTRADPHAHTYMWGMAASLSNATIDGLASYYAAQKPAAPTTGDRQSIAAGKKIYDSGIEAKGVPACQGCHGAQGQGNSTIPRVAGQHPGYLEGQLRDFASNARANAIMHQNAKDLTPAQINALAAYLASL